MSQARVLPNPENASLTDLRATMTAGSREANRRYLPSSWFWIAYEQVQVALDVRESAPRKIVRAFNFYGIGELLAKKRSGRPCALGSDTQQQILEKFEDPGKAQRRLGQSPQT